MADALRSEGRMEAANGVFATVRQVAHATGFDALIRGVEQDYAKPAPSDSAGVTLRVNPTNQPKTQSTEPARKPKR